MAVPHLREPGHRDQLTSPTRTLRTGPGWSATLPMRMDVILWHSRAEAEYAAAHVTEVPEAAAWFTYIDQSRGIEHLEVLSPDD